MNNPDIAITPFTWNDWRALWTIRFAQLGEHGILVETTQIPDYPLFDITEGHEWDFHHIADVYLRGAGCFWLARYRDQPVGYVGAQDVGGAIELRRMYVNAVYRRLGIGAALVRTLIAYCRIQDMPAIELWTDSDGSGRRLYLRFGFRETSRPGWEFGDIINVTKYRPHPTEIRMRLDL